MLALAAFAITGGALLATSAPPDYSVRHSAEVEGPLLTLSASQPEVLMRLRGTRSASTEPEALPTSLDVTLHLRQHAEVAGNDAAPDTQDTVPGLVRVEVLHSEETLGHDPSAYSSGVFLRDLSFTSAVPLSCASTEGNECLDVTFRFSLAEPPFDNQRATVSWSVDLLGEVYVDDADEDADVSLPLDLALTREESEQP